MAVDEKLGVPLKLSSTDPNPAPFQPEANCRKTLNTSAMLFVGAIFIRSYSRTEPSCASPHRYLNALIPRISLQNGTHFGLERGIAIDGETPRCR